ncbi:MAG: autotransporter-associated beta strand repeat-containing protein, partial [Akkermansia sp.]
ANKSTIELATSDTATGGVAKTASFTLGHANATLAISASAVTIAGLAGTAGKVQSEGAGEHTLTINQALDTEFSGIIGEATGGGTMGIVKDGVGLLTLSGANTYTGGTTITGGALKVANHVTALGAGNVTINGGTLDATNKHLGNKITIQGGKVSNFAKSGAGTLKEVSLLATNKDTNKTITIDKSFLQATTADSVKIGLGNQLIMMGGSTVTLGSAGQSNVATIALGQINLTNGANQAAMTVTSGDTLTLAGTWTLDLSGFNPSENQDYVFQLISLADSGTYADWVKDKLDLTYFTGFTITGNDGFTVDNNTVKASLKNDGTVTLTYSGGPTPVVPEPSTVSLTLLALTGLLLRRRRAN